MSPQHISKGAVFWRKPADQTVDTSRKPHHWVVLVDPVVLDGCEWVLWVPLSSFKPWTDPAETYVFNVGKKNKYIEAKRDSCPFLKFAEVRTVSAIKAENPARHGEIPPGDVVGICEALMRSGATPRGAARFYQDHGDPLEGQNCGNDEG